MRTLSTIALSLLAVQAADAASAGCGKAPPSSGVKTVTVNGRQRQYILQLPNNYDRNKPHRVVFGFHWLGGSMNDVANNNFYDLRSRGASNTIFVAPNGLDAGWANTGGQDIAFVDQIVASLKNDLCVDEGQFFATGFSYGGAMSHSVACSRPNVFKSVSVIAGALLSGCDGGNTPVAYMGIHGAADNVLPIAMGRQLRDKWLQTNGCQNKNAPEPSAGQQTHIKTVYECSRAPVVWIATGNGHVGDPTGTGGVKFAPGETWDFWNSVAGLPGEGGSNPNPTPTTIVTSVIPTPTSVIVQPTQPPANCSPRWGQCGGQGWQGPTCCEAGTTCQSFNPWYSQCL